MLRFMWRVVINALRMIKAQLQLVRGPESSNINLDIFVYLFKFLGLKNLSSHTI